MSSRSRSNGTFSGSEAFWAGVGVSFPERRTFSFAPQQQVNNTIDTIRFFRIGILNKSIITKNTER